MTRPTSSLRSLAVAAAVAGTCSCREIIGVDDLTERSSDAAAQRAPGASGGTAPSAFDGAAPGDAKPSPLDGAASLNDATFNQDSAGANCADACALGMERCGSGGPQTCARQPSGCYDWAAGIACLPHQNCQVIAGAAACVCAADPICKSAAPECESMSAVAVCAKDAQNCFYQASSMLCASGEPCQTGVCGVCGDGMCAGAESCGNCLNDCPCEREIYVASANIAPGQFATQCWTGNPKEQSVWKSGTTTGCPSCIAPYPFAYEQSSNPPGFPCGALTGGHYPIVFQPNGAPTGGFVTQCTDEPGLAYVYGVNMTDSQGYNYGQFMYPQANTAICNSP